MKRPACGLREVIKELCVSLLVRRTVLEPRRCDQEVRNHRGLVGVQAEGRPLLGGVFALVVLLQKSAVVVEVAADVVAGDSSACGDVQAEGVAEVCSGEERATSGRGRGRGELLGVQPGHRRDTGLADLQEPFDTTVQLENGTLPEIEKQEQVVGIRDLPGITVYQTHEGFTLGLHPLRYGVHEETHVLCGGYLVLQESTLFLEHSNEFA